MTEYLQPHSRIPYYFAYPKFLLETNLSETARLVYMLLLDRARLSMGNEQWQDHEGRVFIRYTVASLAQTMGVSPMTVKRALKALEEENLIRRERQGTGKPSRIYVLTRNETEPAPGNKSVPRDGTFLFRNRAQNCSPNKTINKTKSNNSGYERNYDCEEGESL